MLRREGHAKRPGFVASMKKLDRKKNLNENGLLEKKLRPLKVREPMKNFEVGNFENFHWKLYENEKK